MKTHILCNMKDKELQKKLWRNDNTINTCDEVLGVIRDSEASTQQQ